MKTSEARVYSYIRFSRPEQLKGNSLKRQLKMSQEWCNRNGYVLDQSLKLHDLGVSAYRGQNAVRGKLGAFLKAVDEGRVPKGSILLLESLDRLSRNQIGEALELFLGILRNGITIVTLIPEEQFSKESINELVKIIVVLVVMSRAYEESETKSKRLKEAWESKRDAWQSPNGEDQKLLTGMCPGWLKVVDRRFERRVERRFEVMPGAKTTLRMIFDLKLKGMGPSRIAVKLNKDAPWKPGKDGRKRKRKHSGWATSYVKKILTNRAVIGEYQPHKKIDGKRIPEGEPIKGYFPAMVDRDLFFAVQRQMKGKRGTGGPTGKVTNLFTGLVKCAYCGGTMQLRDKGVKSKVKLVCYNAENGISCEKHHWIHYDEVENSILERCAFLKAEQVLPTVTEQDKICRSLRQRIKGKQGELDDLKSQIDNLTQQVGSTESSVARNRYEARMLELDGRVKVLEQEMRDDQQALQQAEGGRQAFMAWKRDFEPLRKAVRSGDVELRLRLQAHLREIIEKVEIVAVGKPFEVDLNNPRATADGKTLCAMFDRFLGQIAGEVGTFDKAQKQKMLEAFLRDTQKRRTTREGRYFVIHFRGSSDRQLGFIPKGSIGGEGIPNYMHFDLRTKAVSLTWGPVSDKNLVSRYGLQGRSTPGFFGEPG